MTAPSPAALRMQRSRQRARHGDVIVGLEVGQKVISDLIELVERAIEVRVTPALSSPGKVSFMLEIQHSTIETLVTFGWLPADQRDDLSAIVKAFRRFVGRSLAVARNSGPDRWYIP